MNTQSLSPQIPSSTHKKLSRSQRKKMRANALVLESNKTETHTQSSDKYVPSQNHPQIAELFRLLYPILDQHRRKKNLALHTTKILASMCIEIARICNILKNDVDIIPKNDERICEFIEQCEGTNTVYGIGSDPEYFVECVLKFIFHYDTLHQHFIRESFWQNHGTDTPTADITHYMCEISLFNGFNPSFISSPSGQECSGYNASKEYEEYAGNIEFKDFSIVNNLCCDNESIRRVKGCNRLMPRKFDIQCTINVSMTIFGYKITVIFNGDKQFVVSDIFCADFATDEEYICFLLDTVCDKFTPNIKSLILEHNM